MAQKNKETSRSYYQRAAGARWARRVGAVNTGAFGLAASHFSAQDELFAAGAMAVGAAFFGYATVNFHLKAGRLQRRGDELSKNL